MNIEAHPKIKQTVRTKQPHALRIEDQTQTLRSEHHTSQTNWKLQRVIMNQNYYASSPIDQSG